MMQADQSNCLLGQAVVDGDVEQVRLALAAGASANAEPNPPLLTACKHGRLDAARLLIAAGACCNVVDKETGAMPLHIASKNGDACMVQLLLESGAEVEGLSRNGNTAVYTAAVCGRADIVQLLLAAGAEKDVPNKQGYTARQAAAANGHVEVVRLLSNEKVEQRFNRPPIHEAAIGGHAEVVSLLLSEGEDKDQVDGYGRTPLRAAAGAGQACVVQMLLQHGADKNKTDWHGFTPLRAAANEGHTHVMQLLLEARVDLEKADFQGCTPLNEVVTRGDVNAVRLLLDAGASVNCSDWFGRAPIHYAAREGHANVLRELLFAGADTELTDGDRCTASQLARNVECSLLLLAAGANFNFMSRRDCTPRMHLLELVAAEDRASAETLGPLEAACLLREPDLLRARLRGGAMPFAFTQEMASNSSGAGGNGNNVLNLVGNNNNINSGNGSNSNNSSSNSSNSSSSNNNNFGNSSGGGSNRNSNNSLLLMNTNANPLLAFAIANSLNSSNPDGSPSNRNSASSSSGGGGGGGSNRNSGGSSSGFPGAFVAACTMSAGNCTNNNAPVTLCRMEPLVTLAHTKDHPLLARPVCQATLHLMQQASLPWSPKRHLLFGRDFRRAVLTLLLVHTRLAADFWHREDALQLSAEDGGGVVVLRRKGNKKAPLSPLPAEIWHLIISFLDRGAWSTKTNQCSLSRRGSWIVLSSPF